MIAVIVIDFIGICGENPTEIGKSSSHACLHACEIEKISKMSAITIKNLCFVNFSFLFI